LKILLDEMYPYVIAERLCGDCHDVDAVTARPELRGLSDDALFALAQAEHRVVATENVADFCRIADELDRSGRIHHGLVLVAPARYQHGAPRTIGLLVTALGHLLNERPGENADSRRDWL
jgi:hypothetical protein